MKKKHLQLKQLKLTKETVLNLSEVKGGAVGTGGSVVVLTTDCAKTQQVGCTDTQGTVMPCCPGCRSGANNTVVKQYCTVITTALDCAFEPANPLG